MASNSFRLDYKYYQRASASQKRINEFLEEKSDIILSDNKKINLKGKIGFKCFYKYSDTKIEGMNNVSFIINPGESLGIIGSTGSGKSTIANSILRLFDADKGKILIDNNDIKNLISCTLENKLAMFPKTFSFSRYN